MQKRRVRRAGHTWVVGQVAEQADLPQVLWGGDGEGQHVPDGLVEARVGAPSEADGLVLVLQVVLDVAHLVVHGEKLLHGYCGTLFDPGHGKANGFQWWITKADTKTSDQPNDPVDHCKSLYCEQ